MDYVRNKISITVLEAGSPEYHLTAKIRGTRGMIRKVTDEL